MYILRHNKSSQVVRCHQLEQKSAADSHGGAWAKGNVKSLYKGSIMLQDKAYWNKAKRTEASSRPCTHTLVDIRPPWSNMEESRAKDLNIWLMSIGFFLSFIAFYSMGNIQVNKNIIWNACIFATLPSFISLCLNLLHPTILLFFNFTLLDLTSLD